MNLSLPNIRVRALPSFEEDEVARSSEELGNGECTRMRRLRSLLSLLALYAAALLSVVVLSDGADIGCILAGIAGHVLYASAKTAHAWREASWLEHARTRIAERRSRRVFAIPPSGRGGPTVAAL